MQGDGVIQTRLDLLIRLQDTTTGLSMDMRTAKFILGDKEIRPKYRGDGNFILIDHGRENNPMQVILSGYEPYEIYIDYDKLDENLPTADVFLIPSESRKAGKELLSLSGKRKGLSSLECIHPGRPLSGIREFDVKKKVMTMYAPNRRMNMVHSYYGLLNTEEGNYEPIEIVEQTENNKVRLRDVLQKEFAVNAPICRRIFGTVKEDGSYLLRVRDDGKKQTYIVRYIIDGEERFKSVDFRDLKEVTLD